MTSLLVRLFIKNRDDILNPEVRQEYGILSGAVGIGCNIILFVIKFLAGLMTSSISIMADAFNNLSDAGSSIVTLIGFKMAGKPADTDHPFGHGRIEYISGFIIAFAILLMGVELFKSSIEKIINPNQIEFTTISLIILVVSIFIKIWLALFNRKLGRKLDASAMLATATDSLNDSVATTVVLISLLIFKIFNVNVDGYSGLLVALFVLYSGYNTASDTIKPLLGQAPDPDFVKKIEDTVLQYDGIEGVHDIVVHDYGPGRVIISLHAEIPCDMNVMKAHEIIDTAEEDIKAEFGCQISIHMDPIATNDETINRLKDEVCNIARGLDERLDIHDFRIVDGSTRKNMIFDIAIPFEFKMSDDDVRKYMKSKIKKLSKNYFVVIKVDKKSY